MIVWLRAWLLSASTRLGMTSLFPALVESLTVSVVLPPALLIVMAPRVSVRPAVPPRVMVRELVTIVVPFARLRSFVPPKVKFPLMVVTLAVLSVIRPPELLSMVPPVLSVIGPVPMAEALLRCKAPAETVVVPL